MPALTTGSYPYNPASFTARASLWFFRHSSDIQVFNSNDLEMGRQIVADLMERCKALVMDNNRERAISLQDLLRGSVVIISQPLSERVL